MKKINYLSSLATIELFAMKEDKKNKDDYKLIDYILLTRENKEKNTLLANLKRRS